MVLLISTVAGITSMALGAHKNRNPFGWFVAGFFFPVVGVIATCVVSHRAPKGTRS